MRTFEHAIHDTRYMYIMQTTGTKRKSLKTPCLPNAPFCSYSLHTSCTHSHSEQHICLPSVVAAIKTLKTTRQPSIRAKTRFGTARRSNAPNTPNKTYDYSRKPTKPADDPPSRNTQLQDLQRLVSPEHVHTHTPTPQLAYKVCMQQQQATGADEVNRTLQVEPGRSFHS